LLSARWAGSQRYPLHWGGVPKIRIRRWQPNFVAVYHLDSRVYILEPAGGFVDRAPRDLYRRWFAFGA
jgi:alpha-D-xyloside xylohydrolase